MWRLVAWVCSRPKVAEWLIERSKRTPYSDITSPDGADVYMRRWWLFNPYPGLGNEMKRYSWLPSVRVHHICREDIDRHMHDHPWNARTIILRGAYLERRLEEGSEHPEWLKQCPLVERRYLRSPGSTARIKFGEYHSILDVSTDGVFTLFITWRYQGTWGFLVDGKKTPWREYLGVPKP